MVENLKLDKNQKILFSFMGSGEPLLNINVIIKTIKYLKEKFVDAYFSLSLSGTNIKNLDKLIEDKEIKKIKPKIQFSLHSANEEKRKKLIYLTDKLDKIFQKLIEYRKKIGDKIEINYILLNGINDSVEDFNELVELINKYKFKLKINKYHKVNSKISESKNKNNFIKALKNKDIVLEEYVTDGFDIGAGCGQLFTNKIIQKKQGE